MEPTEVLMEEHRVIERVLNALETAASRLAVGEAVSPAVFVQAADFMSGFADGCHHQKEEVVLFPAMEEAGVPNEQGPIGIMLDEHVEGRRLTRAMRGAAERLQAGDDEAADELARAALEYIDLLRQHIAKEDNVLFPMADQVLEGAARSDVADAFDRLQREESDSGEHARYLALAAAIEREMAV